MSNPSALKVKYNQTNKGHLLYRCFSVIFLFLFCFLSFNSSVLAASVKSASVNLNFKVSSVTKTLVVSNNSFSSYSSRIIYLTRTELMPETYELKVTVRDEFGNTSVYSLPEMKVYASLEISDTPMNYPNPFNPLSGQNTTIRYKLSQAADVKLSICDLSSRMVYSRGILEGEEGGKADNNYVVWDGKDFSGQVVSNGVYVYFITSAGRVLGSGEIIII